VGSVRPSAGAFLHSSSLLLNGICLSDRLSYQSAIGKRLGLGGPACQIVEELVFIPASVETVDEFLEVTIEMFVTDAVEGPDQPGLEVGDDRVSPGQDFSGGFQRAQRRGLVFDACGLKPVSGLTGYLTESRVIGHCRKPSFNCLSSDLC
jgi:hypothetical protein